MAPEPQPDLQAKIVEAISRGRLRGTAGCRASAIIQTLREAGYVIVPREPTEEMVAKGRAAASAWLDLGRGDAAQIEKYRRRWQAMVDAFVEPKLLDLSAKERMKP